MALGWGKKTVVEEPEEQEMSMEEILASIRKYVSEDSKEETEPVEKEGRDNSPPSSAKDTSANPSLLNSEQPLADSPSVCQTPVTRSSIMETMGTPNPFIGYGQSGLSEPVNPVTSPRPHSIERTQKRQEDSMVTYPTTDTSPSSRTEDLLSPSSVNLTAQSFSKLVDLATEQASAASQAPHSPPKTGVTPLTLDQLFIDLARPVIQGWLEKHLPKIAEEMVTKEIQRIREKLGLPQ